MLNKRNLKKITNELMGIKNQTRNAFNFKPISKATLGIPKNRQINHNMNMNTKQFLNRTKGVNLLRFKDSDKDGLINGLDCKPFNRLKQGDGVVEKFEGEGFNVTSARAKGEDGVREPEDVYEPIEELKDYEKEKPTYYTSQEKEDEFFEQIKQKKNLEKAEKKQLKKIDKQENKEKKKKEHEEYEKKQQKKQDDQLNRDLKNADKQMKYAKIKSFQQNIEAAQDRIIKAPLRAKSLIGGMLRNENRPRQVVADQFTPQDSHNSFGVVRKQSNIMIDNYLKIRARQTPFQKSRPTKPINQLRQGKLSAPKQSFNQKKTSNFMINKGGIPLKTNKVKFSINAIGNFMQKTKNKKLKKPKRLGFL